MYFRDSFGYNVPELLQILTFFFFTTVIQDSNPIRHLGNFKPHGQNLEDVSASVVYPGSKFRPQCWIEQRAVRLFNVSVSFCTLRLVVPCEKKKKKTPLLCFASFIRGNNLPGFSLERLNRLKSQTASAGNS